MGAAVAGEAILKVHSVRVRFGKLWALKNVSLEVRGGDLLGLIGPNGAGKTTLLRTIAGLQRATGGRTEIIGELMRPENFDALRQVGFTPDTPPVYEDLTVRQFLQFVGKGYGLGTADTNERIDFWLEKVWLTEKKDQKIKTLSRGMKQRMGIARTLLPNPAVILLDEPAAGLDPAGRVQFRKLLVDLRTQGKALIVSSHILADMEEYCTHIGIMAAGEMVRFGTVAEVCGHGDSTHSRYSLELARPVAGLGGILAQIAGVAVISADGDCATLEFERDKEALSRLLAEMIGKGLAVSAFGLAASGLEEVYLRAGVRQVD
ncbi:MAG TPA: ABC transporter ATP-binding protein [Tepidisphaeraceae bacterium]|nr:ABC transporter ATP-binding protein [Tepidisphaeraceae bacterium]